MEHQHNHNCEHDYHEHDDYFEALLKRLPPQIKALPHEQQVAYVENLLENIRKHETQHQHEEQMRQEYKETVRKNYKFLHSDLLTLKSSFFVKSFWDAIQSGTPEAIKAILKEESPGIYSFDMLTKEYCDKLLEEIAHFENCYGAILDDFGMYDILQEWVKKLVSPFARVLYPYFGGETLDDHHGFVVEYKLGKDIDLGFHVDNSEVTLNVCLGKEFQGGTLYFEGVRCAAHQNTPSNDDEHFVYSHITGRGIIHVGRHRHGANELLSGERYNLILWCYSSQFRSDSKNMDGHNSWCCWKKKTK